MCAASIRPPRYIRSAYSRRPKRERGQQEDKQRDQVDDEVVRVWLPREPADLFPTGEVEVVVLVTHQRA